MQHQSSIRCQIRGAGAAILIAVLCAPAFLFAQAVTGYLIGTVTDPSGAPVPGASVSVTNAEKGITVTTKTNESGNYTQMQLVPGVYQVAVEAPDFRRAVRDNIVVDIGRSTRVDAQLELGPVTEEVTVRAAGAVLQTDRAELSTAVTTREVENLPTFNRNFTSLQYLLPGAGRNPWQHASSENPQGGLLIPTNGQQFSTTNFMLDGTDNNDPVLGIIVVNPNIESVGEFKVTNSNFDAEFAQAGGAVVQVDTKSGANEIHGSAFDFLQNNIFQARDPFTQGLHAPGTPEPAHRGIPPLRSNQFGASIAGPVIKDKLFYFGDYEGWRRRLGGSVLTRVPTAAERTGDLSGLNTPIFDPLSGNADGTGRTPFEGANIPSSRIAIPSANLLGLLPAPNLIPANPFDPNYAVNQVQSFDANKFNVRADYYVRENLRIFGRYSYAGFLLTSPPAFGIYGGPFPSIFGFSGKSDTLNQNLSTGFNYNFGPTLLTDVRFGFNRYRVLVRSLDGDQALADQVGIPGLNISGRPDTLGLPRLNINGPASFTMGFQCNCPLDEIENVFQWVSTWTKFAGNHTLKWGADIRHAQNTRLPSDQRRSGVYNFDPSVTALADETGVTGGLGLASFLTGNPSQFSRFAQISTDQQDRQNRMFYFVQDSWRITPKLTFNIGMRWDTWFPDYSKNAGQGGRYDVTDNMVRIPGVGGISQSADMQTQWSNISPRVGLAYALGQKTVLRTGYGRSYFQGTFGWTFNNLAADVYPSIVNQQLNQPTRFLPVFPLTQAPPAPVFPEIPSNGLLPLADGIGVSYIPANQKIPYADSWNFSVEHSLTPTLTAQAAYVGNVGRHLNGGFGLNAAIPGPGPLNPRRPLYEKFGLTQGIFDKCDCTSSNYNALQLRGQKRFSSGYSLIASYTWSKTIDFGAFGTPTNQYNANQDRGLSDFDRAHVFTLAHDVMLPFGKGQRFLPDVSGIANQIVSGWEFTGTSLFYSGQAFSPGVANNSFLNADQGSRPDQVIADPYQSVPQSRDGWFNPAAYAYPALYQFGNAGRNTLRGPGIVAMNWSLFKTFSVAERYKLQFRWEVYNAFNRTNLANPDSSFDSGSAGKIFGISEPMRNMQFALRFSF
jgi:hypothetical protein